jgi:protein-tyrosine kinase
MSRMFRALERAESEAKRTSAGDLRPSRITEPVPDLDLPELSVEYERLRVMLSLATSGPDLRSVMFVSALSGEGVSTVTLGFACMAVETAAQGVLVIDAHPARPDLAARLGVVANGGLAELLDKEITQADAILKTPVQRLLFTGPGRKLLDLSRARARDHADELLADLRAAFDYVVVDGGALRDSSDSLLLASRVDAVVLVVRAEHTGIEAAQAATVQLRRAGANLVGTILNGRREYLPGFLARRL